MVGPYPQSDFNYSSEEKIKRNRKKRRGFLILGITVLSYILFNARFLNKEIDVKNDPAPFLSSKGGPGDAAWFKRFASLLFFNQNQADEVDTDYIMPEKESSRLDILILGIRGEDAEEAGALLTDTMMIFSHDQLTKRSSLVSIPRDLYVKIYDKKDKINSAYEYGLLRKDGVDYVKKLASQITGVYIDNIIVIDFSSFEKLVDQLGGIDIILTKPFKEEGQWGYLFELPTGENHLNGQDALYYVRSRYSTNDFDRAFRQQQVLFAIKDKLAKLNVLTDPVKTLSVINTLNQNIKTDINILDIKEIIDLGKEVDTSPVMFKKQVVSTDNLLYQTTGPEGAYILLPQGDSFDQIKQLFQDIIL